MLQSFLPLLREEYQKLIRQQQQDELTLKKITSDKGVIVEGIDNCQIKFAQCCHPLPGDDIIGYITRGSVRGSDEHQVFKTGGLTIHRADCANAPLEPSRAPEPDRWLRARWGDTGGSEYLGAIAVRCANKTRATADIAALLRNLHIDLSDFHSHGNSDGTGSVYAVIAVHSREHLEQLRAKVFQIKGVTEVD
jgi:GTP pyrophosphokinase